MAKMKQKNTKMMKADKAIGTGETRLKFNNDPTVAPSPDEKKPNKKLEMSLFGPDALESQVATTPDYAAKSKKGYFNENAWKHIEDNEVSPTTNY